MPSHKVFKDDQSELFFYINQFDQLFISLNWVSSNDTAPCIVLERDDVVELILELEKYLKQMPKDV